MIFVLAGTRQAAVKHLRELRISERDRNVVILSSTDPRSVERLRGRRAQPGDRILKCRTFWTVPATGYIAEEILQYLHIVGLGDVKHEHLC